MIKFTKGKVKIHPKEGVEMEGKLSPYLRFCIGTGMLLVAASPFLVAFAYFYSNVLK